LARKQQTTLAALRGRLQRRGKDDGAASKWGRRKLVLSPARRAALKVQGEYMGLVRRLKPRERGITLALRLTCNHQRQLRDHTSARNYPARA